MVDEIAIPIVSTVDFPNKKPSDDPVIPGQPADHLSVENSGSKGRPGGFKSCEVERFRAQGDCLGKPKENHGKRVVLSEIHGIPSGGTSNMAGWKITEPNAGF